MHLPESTVHDPLRQQLRIRLLRVPAHPSSFSICVMTHMEWFFSSTKYAWTREVRIKNTNLDSRTIWSLLGEKSYLSKGVSQALHLHFRWCLLVWQKRISPRPQNDQCVVMICNQERDWAVQTYVWATRSGSIDTKLMFRASRWSLRLQPAIFDGIYRQHPPPYRRPPHVGQLTQSSDRSCGNHWLEVSSIITKATAAVSLPWE